MNLMNLFKCSEVDSKGNKNQNKTIYLPEIFWFKPLFLTDAPRFNKTALQVTLQLKIFYTAVVNSPSYRLTCFLFQKEGFVDISTTFKHFFVKLWRL